MNLQQWQWLQRGPLGASDLPTNANPDLYPDPDLDAASAPPAANLSQMAGPPPSSDQPPFLSNGFANQALNLAAIIGGLGLGLARPRVAPQAQDNFQMLNTMQWRDEQRKIAQQRLAIQQREEETKRAILGQILAPEDGTPPTSPQVAATRSTGQLSAPQSPAPQVSEVPHFAASMPNTLTRAPQLVPQDRMAQPPDQPFLTSPPSPILGELTQGLSAYGLSRQGVTKRGTEREQATNNAISDMSAAWLQYPDRAQRDPVGLYNEVRGRYKQADTGALREDLTTTVFDEQYRKLLDTGLDPKSQFRQAYQESAKLLPGIFRPSKEIRTQATNIASMDEQEALAVVNGDKSALKKLNVVKGDTAYTLRGAQNTADVATKPLTPTELQQFRNPPPVGTTQGQLMGKAAPMSRQEEINVTTSERDRTERKIMLEAVAPSISSVVRRAEELRKGFADLSLMNIYQKGKNWLDVAQSQMTGVPLTELGKLVTSYDDMVRTSGTFMAKAVQGNSGVLTEPEQAVGRQGFPQTFRELVNNPVGGNDRMAVLGTVLAVELRDPTFHLDRLDVPMSEFEKSVEAHRQQLIATRPELFTDAPRLAPAAPTLPGQAPAASAPPTVPPHILTPEDQAVKDRVNQEIQEYLNRRPPAKGAPWLP